MKISTKYIVPYHNGPLRAINSTMLKRQKKEHNLERILDASMLKRVMQELIEESSNKDEIRDLALNIELIDYELQYLWGFETDKRFHRFWETPKCSCPSMDNIDDYPHLQYIDKNCIVHGA